MATAVQTFGSTLRWWRTNRRYSQLQLAIEAEVSSRHISFLETGRAKPSREMVVHLAIALDLSLRDRNALLDAAGYAPVYPHSALDAPEMDDVRRVLGQILAAHSPNPAVVVDRRGELIDANTAAFALIGATVAPDSAALTPSVNINRLALHPEGIKPRTADWELGAANVLQRLEREQAHRPADEQLEALLAEMLSYPGVEELRRHAALPTGADLLVPLEVNTFDGATIRLVSTVATIGAPYDVTLDELRLETFFPSDNATRDVLARWQPDGEAGGAGPTG
ncbi:MAG: helix-turn-helix transcriptional regulator [Acidimicrobiales bacterium]|nr:helix-turn-helix transcriptional regulator [Acidimicrobiales bacterium]